MGQLSVVAGEPAAFVYLVDLAEDDDINNSLGTYYSDAQTPKRNRNNHIQLSKKHRLRHIDIHLAYCKDATNTGYRIRPGPSKMKSRFNPSLTPESA